MVEEKQRWVLLRKLGLGIFWFVVMWLGMHTLTNFVVGLNAGRHIHDVAQARQVGAAAAQSFSGRYGPVLLAIAIGMTMRGLRSGLFLSKKLRQDRVSKA